MGVRLALLDEGRESALIFESAHASSCNGSARRLSTGKTVVLATDPMADITVRELPLSNTLLASAVMMKKARFVRDCATYLQNCPTPARDVFTHASDPVSSIVVVPLVVGNQAMGALYFTQDTPCDFSNIQDSLLGFVHVVTPMLHAKMAGQMDMLRGMANAASRRSSAEFASGASGPYRHLLSQMSSSESEADENESASASFASARLSKVSSKRLCTESILRVLQQDIRRSRRRSVELSGVSDLVIDTPLGRGGYGSVYNGTWHQTPAAIKVMNARNSNSEAVSDAMEMAVLSSVQHPNIVQVYCCLTDMVLIEDYNGSCDSANSFPSPPSSVGRRTGSSLAALNNPQMKPRFRRLLPGEEIDVPTYNIVVMEHCDRGTLSDAVRAGMFHHQLDNGAIGVDLAAVVEVGSARSALPLSRSLAGLPLLKADFPQPPTTNPKP